MIQFKISNSLSSIISSLFFVICTLTSCTGPDDVKPDLLATHQLRGSPSFGVVNKTYVRTHAKSEETSPVMNIMRGGDIVSINDRSLAQVYVRGILDYWYLVRTGETESWIFGGDLILCKMDLEAETISRRIKVELFDDG